MKQPVTGAVRVDNYWCRSTVFSARTFIEECSEENDQFAANKIVSSPNFLRRELNKIFREELLPSSAPVTEGDHRIDNDLSCSTNTLNKKGLRFITVFCDDCKVVWAFFDSCFPLLTTFFRPMQVPIHPKIMDVMSKHAEKIGPEAVAHMCRVAAKLNTLVD
jgi:hypothetical protein